MCMEDGQTGREVADILFTLVLICTCSTVSMAFQVMGLNHVSSVCARLLARLTGKFPCSVSTSGMKCRNSINVVTC